MLLIGYVSFSSRRGSTRGLRKKLIYRAAFDITADDAIVAGRFVGFAPFMISRPDRASPLNAFRTVSAETAGVTALAAALFGCSPLAAPLSRVLISTA